MRHNNLYLITQFCLAGPGLPQKGEHSKILLIPGEGYHTVGLDLLIVCK